MSEIEFSAKAVLGNLMDFQKRTTDYAFRRLFTARDSTDRFLVADEVGLGKTMVARGIAAKTIQHLKGKVGRIDIVYVCSNSAIAQQNLARLRMPGIPAPVNLERLGMMPLKIAEIEQQEVCLVAFTPGTSFQVRGSLGRKEERAVLLALLGHRYGWGRAASGARGFRIMQGDAAVESFRSVFQSTRARLSDLDSNEPAKCFWDRLAACDDLRAEWDALRPSFGQDATGLSRKIRTRRAHLVGELRHMLASASLDALQPDLIILDEFQRFAHLLSDTELSEETELARELFGWSNDERCERARVLMLSATPYKMYTLDSERSTDDHYEDLLKTLDFLVRSNPRRMRALRKTLSDFGRAVDLATQEPDLGIPELEAARSALERELRRVMSRTERMGATSDHGGMLEPLGVPDGVELTTDDVRDYAALRSIASKCGQGDPSEYWKSIPYPITYLYQYQFRKGVDGAVARREVKLADIAPPRKARSSGITLPVEEVEGFGQIALANPRLRALAQSSADSFAARALWVPPVMSYYGLSSPFAELADKRFTKRLVFSAWRAVPRAVASLLTYEAERLTFSTTYRGQQLGYSDPKKGTPIRFRMAKRRITGLGAWAWLYPSSVLAERADPLVLWQQASRTLAPEEMLDAAEAVVEPLLESALAGLGVDRRADSKPDSNWYWLAPMLIDAAASPGLTESALDCGRLSHAFASCDQTGRRSAGDDLLDSAAAKARAFLDDPSELGPMPTDLARVTACLALAGPATCALRALARSSSAEDRFRDADRRALASAAAKSLRDLFNRPHSIAAVRCSKKPLALSRQPYWLHAIVYCYTGGVQAMLDEYVHVLQDGAENETEIVQAMSTALGVVAATIEANNPADLEPKKIRTHHAAAFGLGQASNDQQTARTGHLRDAFNSPFKPFVLISTSVGQEGLDFHRYCHAIVHWNLPGSPVDFEQREGRVHRFKGHAVRKNVVEDHATSAPTATDPWTAVFAAAAECAKRTGASEMVPYWVYPQRTDPERHARVIREVPELPHSRDSRRREQLQRTLSAYRMVFGQPRQEDLVAFLVNELDDERLTRLRSAAAVNLEPLGRHAR